jgi:hypothetical protein
VTIIKEVLLVLDSIGVFTVVLPFILSFAILYGVFTRVSFWGPKGHKYDVMLAAVISLFVVGTLYIVDIIQTIVVYSSLGILGIIFVLLLTRFIKGGEWDWGTWPTYIGLGLVGTISLYSLGFAGWIVDGLVDGIILPILLSLAFFAGMAYFVVGSVSDSGTTGNSGSAAAAKKPAATLDPQKEAEAIFDSMGQASSEAQRIIDTSLRNVFSGRRPPGP